ncbi:T9SS type B sorting domain-containing protein [Kaistella sp. G5-32]|uniref:T9SS type B sorting domain-containing protein n=1 Tax=Kaistella gelatinilytica TaxID=2787636 RepID=A0ABS0FA92_9FLAO|nr:T9SS type B sorting domain-containing protein [Kaistella gelatinilytica]MBF8456620.1 T9SS type B sorting domain-containing protein [Kaistella gelatinilytica]
MKKLLLLLFLHSFSIVLFSQNHTTRSDHFFYENKGQIVDQDGKENSAVKYLFNSGGLNVQIKNSGFSYDVYETRKTFKKKQERTKQDLPTEGKKRPEFDLQNEFHRVDIQFLGANHNSEIIAEGKSEDYDNYYNLPNNPKGVENVHRFEKVTYKNLYPNIDLVFFKPDDTLRPVEYNFIVNPGGKISDIKLKFQGAKTKLKDGKLSMTLRFGEMQENIPHSWEEIGSAKNSIDVQFKDLGNQTFGFASTKDSSDKTIVIDPVPTRIWGSYFGGDGEEYAWIRPDNNNNIYLFGYSTSTNNVATTGSYQNYLAGGGDAFISKISKNGQRFWGTYYGKKYFDTTGSLDFDANFNIYAAIVVEKPNPLYPGNRYYFYQKIVLLKLNSNGNLILENEIGREVGNPAYSGYSDETEINDVKLLNNKVYITGKTRLNVFGTAGAFQENIGVGETGFLTKFDAITGANDFFTYIGGNGPSVMYSIFNTDATGIELSGISRGTDFPMIDAFQQVNNGGNFGNNGLYVKFSEAGNLLKSSYFGNAESYFFLSTRRFGNEVMFAGKMYTQNKLCYFLVDTALNTVKDYKEVSIYNSDGDIYIDNNKNIFASGRASPNDPWINQQTTTGSYLPNIGQYISTFYTKYDSNFQKIWSTFYQGSGGTQLGMITKDYDNYLYLWGLSSRNYTGIATPGTFQQTTNTNNNDMYIAKFADCASNVTVSFVPTCINQNLQLNASGGTSYEWFGPNNFHSLIQNPVINNAQASDSGEYFVRITGGQSCGGIFSVIVNIGSPTLPVLDIPNLPNITAFCKITITTIPTATTGCGTKINATTTDPLTYNTPGNYVIHWFYNDGNGHILNQNQNVSVQGVALPNANATQNFCAINTPKISDIQISGTSIKWCDAAGNLLSLTTLLVNGNKYFATQTLNGCESSKTEITVTLNDPNPPTGNATQDFCSAQLSTISNIIIVGQNIKWFDAAGTVLATSTPLVDGKTYFATQTLNGCESTQKLAVKVNVTNGGIPANDYSTVFCNPTTDNTKAENLNNFKGNLIVNPANYLFEFFNANNQLITDPSTVSLILGSNLFNVKISNNLGCFVFVKLTLTLNPKPNINLPTDVEFCNGQSANLDAGIGFSSYEWTKSGDPKIISTKQILVVTEAGKYSIKVKNTFGCENSALVTVKQSVLATITGVQIVNNTATVQISTSGDFIYSLDNLTWQNSNVFTNLNNGNYTVYVKTKLGCIIGTMNFSIFNVTNIFTPNADGINDTWKISGLENYPNSEIKVFDRFGTMVLNKITNGTFEWDGTFNSRHLPTGSYWYIIKVSDGRLLSGWLVLKNRN